MNNNPNNNNLNGSVLGGTTNDNPSVNPNINSNGINNGTYSATPINQGVESLGNPVPVNQDSQLSGGQVINNPIVEPTVLNSNTNNMTSTPSNDLNGVPLNGGPVPSEVNTNMNGQMGSVSSNPTNVEPTPAYTNPQFMNPNNNSMPGFDNSNTIGTNPPATNEPEKKPKKNPKTQKNNKTLFVVIIIVVLAGVGFGTFYVLKYTNILNKKPQITITTKDLEINIGEKLSTNIADYATITGTSSTNCSLDIVNVDTKTAGSYEYKITCGETIKSGKVNVIDNSELVVNIKPVYKVKGDAIAAKEFAVDENDGLTYEFKEEVIVKNYLNTVGTYMVKIKVTDKNKKSTEVEGKLVVMEYAIKGYLKCKSNEQNVTGSSAIMVENEMFAIVDDNDNSYGNIAYESRVFKFSDETEYANYVAKYKTDKKIKIGEYEGTPTFDDDTLTITLMRELDQVEVGSKYGDSNLKTYRTISDYFENTLKYSCIYDKDLITKNQE